MGDFVTMKKVVMISHGALKKKKNHKTTHSAVECCPDQKHHTGSFKLYEQLLSIT